MGYGKEGVIMNEKIMQFIKDYPELIIGMIFVYLLIFFMAIGEYDI